MIACLPRPSAIEARRPGSCRWVYPFTTLRQSFAGLGATVAAVLRKAEPLAPQAGGINIEGLAATPDGRLLIGFRSPLVDGKALILQLRNPAAVVERGVAPVFDEPALLDLGGAGIRSIEPKVGSTAPGYWLLAGAPGEGGQARLYEWQVGGRPTAARGVTLPTGVGVGEGLTVDAASTTLIVSMDGGDIGTPPCKDRPVNDRVFTVSTATAR